MQIGRKGLILEHIRFQILLTQTTLGQKFKSTGDPWRSNWELALQRRWLIKLILTHNWLYRKTENIDPLKVYEINYLFLEVGYPWQNKPILFLCMCFSYFWLRSMFHLPSIWLFQLRVVEGQPLRKLFPLFFVFFQIIHLKNWKCEWWEIKCIQRRQTLKDIHHSMEGLD